MLRLVKVETLLFEYTSCISTKTFRSRLSDFVRFRRFGQCPIRLETTNWVLVSWVNRGGVLERPFDVKTTPGRPSHSTAMGVFCFISPIFWYRSFGCCTLRPCQGSEPRTRYTYMWPSASRSSRRLCSAKPRKRQHDLLARPLTYSLRARSGCTTFAQMGVYAHVPSGARQVLLLPIRYVLVGRPVHVVFGQPEICACTGGR